jgi:hypothetical protein
MDHHTGSLVSIDRHPEQAVLRNFGLAGALVCAGRGVWSASHGAYASAAVGLALALLLVGIARWRSSLLRKPYVLVSVLSFPVRWALSFSVLAVVYFAVITPVAYGVRVARRFKADKQEPQSHWRNSAPRGAKPSYFRQF